MAAWATDHFLNSSDTPVPVSSTLSFTKIFAGNESACALDAEGTAFCWGNNTWGQVGDGTTTDRASPVRVPGISFTTLSIGSTHTCGIATDGITFCWGNNETRAIGDPREGNIPTPTAVAGQ